MEEKQKDEAQIPFIDLCLNACSGRPWDWEVGATSPTQVTGEQQDWPLLLSPMVCIARKLDIVSRTFEFSMR